MPGLLSRLPTPRIKRPREHRLTDLLVVAGPALLRQLKLAGCLITAAADDLPAFKGNPGPTGSLPVDAAH